jgi:hypothetical protein
VFNILTTANVFQSSCTILQLVPTLDTNTLLSPELNVGVCLFMCFNCLAGLCSVRSTCHQCYAQEYSLPYCSHPAMTMILSGLCFNCLFPWSLLTCLPLMVSPPAPGLH